MFKNYLCYKFAKTILPVFKQYPLHPKILEVLNKKELHSATPVQDMLFTCSHKQRLLIGPTGTGKTYAYLLPMLGQLKLQEEEQKCILTEKCRPRALIVVSTKELADQVEEVSQEFTKSLKLSTLALGRSTFRKEQGILKEGVDLVVTTIDRLQRHRSDRSLFLSKVQHYVVDEIDTLLDSQMQDQLKQLALYFQETDTTVTYCGATYSNKVSSFMERIYKKEIQILIEKQSHMHLENLAHDFVHCTTLDKSEPFLVLFNECQAKFKGSMIIFCNEITSCHFLEHFCKKNAIKSVSLHGDLPKGVRQQNVAQFRSQSVKILITTDLGARGLDFPFVDAIINFDFPKSTSDYLHRAGRAGRAGRKGYVFSLYHNSEQKVIDELKQANEGDRPIRIEESAYSRSNKEDKSPNQSNNTKSRITRVTSRPNSRGSRTTTNSKIPSNRTHSSHKHLTKGYKPASREEKQKRTTKKGYFQRVRDGEI